RLLDDMQLVTFLEPQSREQLLRQDKSDRISDFLDLQEIALDLRRLWLLVHGNLSTLYITYNVKLAQNQWARVPDYPSCSSSAIMPSITCRPPCQKGGSRASSPNGLSSSVWCLVPPAASMAR